MLTNPAWLGGATQSLLARPHRLVTNMNAVVLAWSSMVFGSTLLLLWQLQTAMPVSLLDESIPDLYQSVCVLTMPSSTFER